ncbi:hypothetical protein [Enterococcus florum]|nr:hypothetical protein [Enterococcus florum]
MQKIAEIPPIFLLISHCSPNGTPAAQKLQGFFWFIIISERYS